MKSKIRRFNGRGGEFIQNYQQATVTTHAAWFFFFLKHLFSIK